jgi:hypothetical protein
VSPVIDTAAARKIDVKFFIKRQAMSGVVFLICCNWMD